MVKIQNKIIWKSKYYNEDLDSIYVIDKKFTGRNIILVTAKAIGLVWFSL